MSIPLILSLLLINVLNGHDGMDVYNDCGWLGYNIDTPIFPMYICSTYVNEDELNGLYKYSTMYDCEASEDADEEVLFIREWNDTDCRGEPYYTSTYTKDDGMYFNCPAVPRMCPFVQIKIYQLYNDSSETGHDDHLCVIDTNNYEEISLITDYCMDLSGAFGDDFSYYIDCTASSVEFTSFSDDSCGEIDNSTEVEEGCDDPFNWDAYVQIAQCNDDGDVIGSNTLAPTSGPSSSSSSSTMIIIVIAIAVIIIVAAIVIGAFIIRQKRMGAISGVNQESLQQAVSFDRLENTNEE